MPSSPTKRQRRHKPIDKVLGVQFGFRLEHALAEWIEAVAIQQGESNAKIIRDILWTAHADAAFFERYEKETVKGVRGHHDKG